MFRSVRARTFFANSRRRAVIEVISSLTLSSLVLGFEPVRVDPSQPTEPEKSNQIDHLQPVGRHFCPLPEFDYLVQYWAEITTTDFHYIVLRHDKRSDRYYLEQGDPPRTELHGRKYFFKRRREISADTAKIIYEYWVNMLLETRYDRKRLPYASEATVYMFSAPAPVGWLHGYTAHPGVSTDMPPYWLAQTGEALFEFATTAQKETELLTKVKDNRDKFYNYMRSHP